MPTRRDVAIVCAFLAWNVALCGLVIWIGGGR
jgi:hypothetical protein